MLHEKLRPPVGDRTGADLRTGDQRNSYQIHSRISSDTAVPIGVLITPILARIEHQMRLAELDACERSEAA